MRFIRVSDTTTPPATVGASGETCAGTARDERNALSVARSKHRLDVLGRSRKDDELGDRAMSCESVALVDPKLLRFADDVRGAEGLP